jgi:hypothetical protein
LFFSIPVLEENKNGIERESGNGIQVELGYSWPNFKQSLQPFNAGQSGL